jgi:L-fuconolactonase
MRIDAHQHFWKYNPREYKWIRPGVLMHNFMPDDLVPLMAECAFDGTVTVQARTTLEETRWLLDLAAEYPFIKGVVGWVDLCADDLQETMTEFTTNPLFCGVRTSLRVDKDDTHSLEVSFLAGMEILGDFDVAFDLLIRPQQLPMASQLVKTFPEQVFVLDHIANPSIKEHVLEPWATDIRSLAENSNVFCKVSGMVTRADHDNWGREDFQPYLDVVFNVFGVERLMIGSDWPVCTQAASYQQTMNLVLDAVGDLPALECDRILGLNTVNAYKLKL